MKKIFALLILVLILTGCAYADDDRYVREEAARQGMKLITVERVREIASARLDSKNVRFKEIELDNEADDYPNGSYFRPIYQVECFANGKEYDIDVDAVTGEILKFKLDD